MSTVISIEHLTKTYRLGAIGGATLEADFARWWARMRGRPDPLTKIGQEDRVRGEEFLALDDVSFDVADGQVLGIIGRNGAGKSTLLKILSRVTAPTAGRIRIRGRMASLLEVGTGFHPELTGRENIFLNGAILGMSTREIRRKLDEIIAFAEIDQFVDTPVKRYSSGMYVRLAFAVAAHLELEILVVDEVLAVGDAAFQQKCLGKMGDVTRSGNTVLFVSHNTAAIMRLCKEVLWLAGGRKVAIGPTSEVVERYLQADVPTQGEVAIPPPPEPAGVVITKGFVRDSEGRLSAGIDFRFGFSLGLEYVATKRVQHLEIGVRLHNSHGVTVLCSTEPASHADATAPGTYQAWVDIPGHFLVPGRYRVDFIAEVPNVVGFHYPHDCLSFDVHHTGPVDPGAAGTGVVSPKLPWVTTPVAVQ